MGRGGAAPCGQRAEGAGNLRFLSAAEPSARALCASSVYVRDLQRNLGKWQNARAASGLICFAAIVMHEAVRPPAKRRSRFHAPGGESFSRPPKGKVLRVYPIQVRDNGFFHSQKVGARGGGLRSEGVREREGDSHWTLIVPILGGGLTESEREARPVRFSAHLQVSK